MDDYIKFLDRINDDNFSVNDLTIDDYEYLDTYIFDEYNNYSDSCELREKLYKMFDKYILHFDKEEDEFSFLGCLPDEFHIYILDKYGDDMNDVIGLYIRLADGPENMEFVIELLIKNNIIINENSIKNNIDELRECMKGNYFNIDNKDIEKYLENYDL